MDSQHGAALQSSEAPWRDIIVVEQHRLVGGKWHASEPHRYFVGMTLGARAELECRHTSGKVQNERSGGRGFLIVCGSACWRQTHDSDVVFAALDPQFVERVVHDASLLTTKKVIETVGFTDTGIESILLALRAELGDGCPSGRHYGQSLAEALVARLFWLSSTQSAESKHGLSTARLRRVAEYIDANLAGDTSISCLAELVRLSPRQFARLFQESTGLPPHRYVVSRRIAVAQDLLVDGKLSLAELSLSLGFPNQAHFTTTFRTKVGVTPSVFRKTRRQE